MIVVSEYFFIFFATPENAGAKNANQKLNRTKSGSKSIILLAVFRQEKGLIELKHLTLSTSRA
jgi:hypothetical protein